MSQEISVAGDKESPDCDAQDKAAQDTRKRKSSEFLADTVTDEKPPKRTKIDPELCQQFKEKIEVSIQSVAHAMGLGDVIIGKIRYSQKDMSVKFFVRVPEPEIDPTMLYDCPYCKGLGTIKTTFTDASHPERPPEINHLPCIRCEGKGKVGHTKKLSLDRMHEFETNMWCKCDEARRVKYYEDGEHEDCIPKHHYHCGVCKKICQIG